LPQGELNFRFVAEFSQRPLGQRDIRSPHKKIQVAELPHDGVAIEQLAQRQALVGQERDLISLKLARNPSQLRGKAEHAALVILKPRCHGRLDARGNVVPAVESRMYCGQQAMIFRQPQNTIPIGGGRKGRAQKGFPIGSRL
jgi:hypothetical protein